MKLNDQTAKLICELEYHIGKQCFNPKSYDGLNNTFTNNTCIVHHFDATWTPLEERLAIWFVRRKMGFMAKPIYKFFGFVHKTKLKIIGRIKNEKK